MLWRGDAIELKMLYVLSKIYAETARYAEAFAAIRAATRLQPNAPESRQAQDAASALFVQLFSAQGRRDGADRRARHLLRISRADPIGRRGDEMIRRLPDRLVGVDLLDQAAELLDYQVDKRWRVGARPGRRALAMVI